VGSRYIIDIKLAVPLQKQKSTYTPAGVHPNYVGQCKVLMKSMVTFSNGLDEIAFGYSSP
jgi:hypothetical protein